MGGAHHNYYVPLIASLTVQYITQNLALFCWFMKSFTLFSKTLKGFGALCLTCESCFALPVIVFVISTDRLHEAVFDNGHGQGLFAINV